MNDTPRDDPSGLLLKVGVAVVVAAVLAIAYARSGSDESTADLERERVGSALRRERIKARLQGLAASQEKGSLPERRIQPEAGSRPSNQIDTRLERRVHPAAKRPPKPLARNVPNRQPGIGNRLPSTIEETDATNVTYLAGIALHDANTDRRLEAVTLLGATEDPQAVPILAQALADADVEVRIAAIAALADFTEEPPVEALERALNDPNAEVRYEALEVLSEFGGTRARRAIENAAQDPDEDVRWLAETLMDDLEDPDEEEDG